MTTTVLVYSIGQQKRQATVQNKIFDRCANGKAYFNRGAMFNCIANNPPEWVTVVAEGEPGYIPGLAEKPHTDLPDDMTVVIITGVLGNHAEVRTKHNVGSVAEGGRHRYSNNTGVVIGDNNQQTFNVFYKD